MALLIALAAPVLPAAAQACPVCFGEPDSHQARAIQAAIAILGGATGLVLSAILGVVLTIRRRTARREP